MKYFLILFFTSLSITAVYSQEADKALLRVQYTFKHIADTTQKENPYTENMLLIAGKNASLYTSLDQIDRAIALMYKSLELGRFTIADMATVKVGFSETKTISLTDYYFFAKENKLMVKEYAEQDYLVEEAPYHIDWTISSDTASLMGIHCQKASARFKGRNWIAWFSTELPFQSGPWKLNGLPGLIVEAYDDKKEVQFLFAGMEPIQAEAAPPDPIEVAKRRYIRVNLQEIVLPNNATRTTRENLDKLKAARDRDPQGFLNATLATRGINNPNAKEDYSINKRVINNPIELEQ